jgi:hypothetical protein
MNTQGTITFKTAEALAEFIAALIPKSTAVFNVVEDAHNGTFTLEFTGGY